MKITLLIPTRNNFESINIAVKSYLDTADNPNNIDTIIGIDFDEPFKMEIYKKYSDISNIKIVEFPVRHTYTRLHLYYNEMYKYAKGDYFLQTSDDAVMKTKGWDTILQRKHGDYFHIVGFSLRWIPEIGEPFMAGGLIFHATPRKWCEIIGGFGESPHLDSWTGALCGYLESKGFPVLKWENDILVEHDLKTLYGGRKNCNMGDPDSFYKATYKINKQGEMLLDYIKTNNPKI